MIGREKPGEQSEVAQLIQQTLEQERWQREMMEQRYNQYMDEQEVSAGNDPSHVNAQTLNNKWIQYTPDQNHKTRCTISHVAALKRFEAGFKNAKGRNVSETKNIE